MRGVKETAAAGLKVNRRLAEKTVPKNSTPGGETLYKKLVVKGMEKPASLRSPQVNSYRFHGGHYTLFEPTCIDSKMAFLSLLPVR